MMKVKCPTCGAIIEVNGIGRKKLDINFTIVCNALRRGLQKDGNPNFSESARILEKETGLPVGAGFVWQRIAREAQARGITREELLNEILNPWRICKYMKELAEDG